MTENTSIAETVPTVLPTTQHVVNDGIVAKESTDVLDRFFGFTERMICSAESTTNVIIDPVVLKKQEEAGSILTCCLRRATDDADDDITAFASMCPLMDKIPEDPKLEKNASDESGNTEIETVDESYGSKKKRSRGRRGLFSFFSGCRNREEVVNTVVVH